MVDFLNLEFSIMFQYKNDIKFLQVKLHVRATITHFLLCLMSPLSDKKVMTMATPLCHMPLSQWEAISS